MDSTEPAHLMVGQVAAAWGIRGEVKVAILTDFPERFDSRDAETRLDHVLLGDELIETRIERSRLHGHVAVVKFADIDDRNAAEALRGKPLYIPVADAAALPPDTWYWYQLIGLDVVTTTGDPVGRLTEILETGGNDVYVVKLDGRETLVPAIDQVIKSVDLNARRMVIDPLPGM